MKLGIVIAVNDAETVWNAFRLANFSVNKGDTVSVFLVSKGVEYEKTRSEQFDSVAEAKKFLQSDGRILACGTCLKLREKEGSNICPLSTLRDLYELIATSDKIVSF
ncbi:sulfur reduction protein DsrE [Candidatus Micrarchaeota archaeon CG08_land_8_20_14_0_20_49_17]|nr:MAG: sulfur reduction protein DsrE [Candidatus Micrarchaeota archaeon CG1_02_49_24]PIU09785.1 MAG: sulfur reduction protein DsrE [Candidatus Micrarchaeota archaeon CG08_land_8_20_14_0_20_49_17]PIU81567.1 MAG: sulfur reduction protein DsrE [Candidatus Micrarchaeota archaeon CG06_land_8_20_14_3_00_50_6]PIZ93652.1 MAG: sulfur reduction protein DsrE [Candidatus Micrarchaeota archaeon CG_4_10_14_0_2_um_filter_49_7]HII54042.1 sulfur reduction protein DsrE [Candidatus Micrarchaeota archaeon]